MNQKILAVELAKDAKAISLAVPWSEKYFHRKRSRDPKSEGWIVSG